MAQIDDIVADCERLLTHEHDTKEHSMLRIGLGPCSLFNCHADDFRKAKALSTGVADHVIDPSTEDVAERVRELTGGVGADVCFECTSVNAVLDQLFDAVKPAGVIVNVSIWSKPATIDMQTLVLKEIDLRGTIAYVRDHAATIRLVQEGRVTLAPFITSRIGLDDLIDEGFDTLINHNETAVKIIVHS